MSGGERFDPAIHEAVAAVPVLDPQLVDRVVRQSAPAHRFGGRVLRAAKVNVGVASPAARGVHRHAF
jgi:molecular chaperone GrpE